MSPSRQPLLFDPKASRKARDAGIQAARDHADEEWKSKAWIALGALAVWGQPFTTDDVIERTGLPPGHRNIIGALIITAIKRGLIERVGDAHAKRPASHARRVGLYRRKP